MLIGCNMKALFPSLSAAKTSKIVRKQTEKSCMKWKNMSDDWIRFYMHLNRDLCTDIDHIEKLLPRKRKGRIGVEAGMDSRED